MSEETALKLKKAEAALSALENDVDVRKEEFLAAVATHIPRKVAEFAKKTAHSEPGVTTSLGAEGVKAMRAELENLADQLARDVAGASSSLVWPKPNQYVELKFNKLHSALFDFMRPKVEKLAQVFKRNGYDVHDKNRQHAQGLVLPQWFYSEGDLTAETKSLIAGLSQLEQAKLAVQQAKRAHDASTVADLWGD